MVLGSQEPGRVGRRRSLPRRAARRGGSSSLWLSTVTCVIGSATTARLRLLPWSSSFDEGFAAMNADPEVMRHLTGGVPMTPDESRALSDRFAEHWERHGFGLWAA